MAEVLQFTDTDAIDLNCKTCEFDDLELFCITKSLSVEYVYFIDLWMNHENNFTFINYALKNELKPLRFNVIHTSRAPKQEDHTGSL